MNVELAEAKRRAKYHEERILLERVYPDYEPVHHDVFVERYRKDLERVQLADFQRRHGIIE